MFLDLLIRGFIVGLSFTIPGCSGGTFAVYVGVYDRLLHALGNIFKEFKKSMAFLVPFGIGLAGGILLFSWLMGLALQANSFVTIMTFIGLTLGGVPNLWKNVKGHPVKISGILSFVIASAIVVVMVVFQIIGGFDPIASFTFNVGTVVLLFALGVVSAITMIVPGISGSGLLMILGFYTAIVSNVVGNLLDFTRFWYNVAVLVPFGLGAVAGVIGISKVLETTLRKYPVQSFLGIIGFVIASGLTMFLWIRNPSTGDAFLDQAPLYADYAGYLSANVPTLLFGVLGLVVGLIGSIKLIAWGTKNANGGR